MLNFFKKLFHQESQNRRWMVWLVVAVIFLGFLAGIGGEIFARSFIFDYLASDAQIVELNNNFYELLSKYNFLNKADKLGPMEIVIRRSETVGNLTVKQVEAGNFLESLKSGTVTFFKAKKEVSQDVLLTAYQPREALGRGFILTNDGWLVTTSQVLLSVKGDYVAVTSKGEVFNLEKIIVDLLTPAVYAKISANNLSVLNPIKKGVVPLGQELLALDEDGGLMSSLVRSNYYREFGSLADAVVSSDRLDSYYLPNVDWQNLLPGEPLVDRGGNVWGLVFAGEKQKLILPLVNFGNQNDEVLKDGKITRVKLGLDYLNLSSLLINRQVVKKYADLNRGALVYANAALGFSGARKNSPAAKGGVLAGDVILKVEGEEINSTTSLSQLIQSYNPGDQVELTIWRDGQEIKQKVILE